MKEAKMALEGSSAAGGPLSSHLYLPCALGSLAMNTLARIPVTRPRNDRPDIDDRGAEFLEGLAKAGKQRLRGPEVGHRVDVRASRGRIDCDRGQIEGLAVDVEGALVRVVLARLEIFLAVTPADFVV